MNYTYKVSIVIVNLNGKRYLKNLFDSLTTIDTPIELFEVVFVDNGSTDDSIRFVEQYKKILNITIVDTKKNLGFACGNNAGVQASSGEYVVFLNNDTRVDAQWLNELMKMIESDPQIGIVNSKLLFFYDFLRFDINTIPDVRLSNIAHVNGKDVIIDPRFTELIIHNKKQHTLVALNGSYIYIPMIDGVCGYDITFDILAKTDPYDTMSFDFDPIRLYKGSVEFHISSDDAEMLKTTLVQNAGSKINENYDGEDIGFRQQDAEQYRHPYEIDSACGASMMMRRSDFDLVGGFDERFFMYYEDSDLSYRIKKTGKKLMFCPTSIVRHVHTGSSVEWSDFFLYHVVRNKLLFIYKNISIERYKKERWKTILAAWRHRNLRLMIVRIRAADDAQRIIKGKKDIHY